ncbi:MAG TPA: hypothetical protein VF970_05225, partial [Gemmatimonadales bacterium]
MQRRKPKLREDVAERAYRTLQEALGERPKTVPPSERTEDQKNPEAVKRGRKGGKRGGKARADRLTPDQRSDSARRAA